MNATITKFTGEKDLNMAPLDDRVLHWTYFTSDMYSTDRKYSEVADIFEDFAHKMVDLRPYMIE